MRASIPYVERKFDEFNKLIFGGQLKPIPFKMSHARSYLGQIRSKTTRGWGGKLHYSNFVFAISDSLDIPESDMEDIIIHEMIHYYILSRQITDTSPHGVLFHKLMNEINAKFHRHVAVHYSMSKDVRQNDTLRKRHNFGIVRFKNNRQLGIIMPTNTMIFKFWERIPRLSNVENVKWYVSFDPFFNRFPWARTLKIYKITQDELDAHLKGARELINKGGVIYASANVI